ncbi:MAG TPA: right-handed parallel beta-helix repeat-containing protein, partial [Nitrospiraceae bacterium]|nr:right-handed parallel beta-helix repeat-containing protein [Nitrospiraceae bacterium]
MKKLLFLGLLYAALGAASVLTSELLAATLTVTNSNDSGPGSLRESIAIAAPGDEIQFDAGLVSKPIVLISGELLISKDLTITGLGESQTILDGNAVTRILNIASDSHVAISNLTIRNGFDGHLLASGVVGEGGGVYNAGTLSLTHVSILSNTAGLYGIHALSVRGGGVFNNGTITFDHCSLGHNQAVGEISAEGGAIYNLGSATLNDTKVSDNVHQVARAHGVIGAAIYNESSGTVSLVDSEVARNTGVAAGILNYGVIVLSRTTVSDNYGSGDAAIVNGGDATLTDSIIRGNNACPLGTVGGIQNGGFLRADRVLVSENSSCLGRSGGIENVGEMRLTNSTVTNNSVLFGAGGIINNGTADIVSCTITGNRSNSIGGIAMERGDLRIKNTILTGNFCPISNFPGQECGGINTNCSGTGTSLGHNLLSNNSACVWQGDAHLTDAVAADWETIFEGAEMVSYGRAPLLAENGGPTPTIALLPDSAALDFIPPEACTDQEGNPITVDQRGTSRPQG